uniref:RNA-directed RNA polymerase catalytic subunit n=1 Tax=Neotermes castaneus orthomyxovirus 1 TaxID=3133494 RepID=A0AAT9JFT9_9ORTO
MDSNLLNIAFQGKPEIRMMLLPDGRDLPNIMCSKLALISFEYRYINPPPYAHGTPGFKTIESVKRSEEFDKNDTPITKTIGGHLVRSQCWGTNKPFPYSTATSHNFHYQTVVKMMKGFLLQYHNQIDEALKETYDDFLTKAPETLMAGRQTWSPLAYSSITADEAYEEYIGYLNNNGGTTGPTLLNFMHSTLEMWEKPNLRATALINKRIRKPVYDQTIRKKRYVVSEVPKIIDTVYSDDDAYHKARELTTSFCSYLKTKERGKGDGERRAIASANSGLRAFLKLNETFSLHLCKLIPHATISIGGEEKKRKIINEMNDIEDFTRAEIELTQQHGQILHPVKIYGTLDDTKWNECQSAEVMALEKDVFFSNQIRNELGLPMLSHDLANIVAAMKITMYLIASKIVWLGKGPLLQNNTSRIRCDWSNRMPEGAFNPKNQALIEFYKSHIDPEYHPGYLQAPTGMLMGMLNAGSTVVGLYHLSLPSAPGVRRSYLRSSDDSAYKIEALTPEGGFREVVSLYWREKICAINLSINKSVWLSEIFEYTSWYAHSDFVGTYGIEVTTIRPQGNNPQDDFYNVTISTKQSLQTLTLNFLGAECKLRLGINNTRSLWKPIPLGELRNKVSKRVILLANGGDRCWDIGTCGLEETSLRESQATTDDDNLYLTVVRDPTSPFTPSAEDTYTYDKHMGQVIIKEADIPRCIFTYLRRSNRSGRTPFQQKRMSREKSYGRISSCIKKVAPTTNFVIPSYNTNISDFLTIHLKSTRGAYSTELRDQVTQACQFLQGSMDHDQDDGNSE